MDCIEIDCVKIDCIDMPVTSTDCVDSNTLSVTVTAPCTTTATVLVNGGTSGCIAGGVNSLEAVGCCGTIQWIAINAVGHTGTATILDATANPTQFVTSARGAYEFIFDCCE